MGLRLPADAREELRAAFQLNPARLGRGLLVFLFAGQALFASGDPLCLWIALAAEISFEQRDRHDAWLWIALAGYLALLLVAPWSDMGKLLQHLRHYNGW